MLDELGTLKEIEIEMKETGTFSENFFALFTCDR